MLNQRFKQTIGCLGSVDDPYGLFRRGTGCRGEGRVPRRGQSATRLANSPLEGQYRVRLKRWRVGRMRACVSRASYASSAKNTVEAQRGLLAGVANASDERVAVGGAVFMPTRPRPAVLLFVEELLLVATS